MKKLIPFIIIFILFICNGCSIKEETPTDALPLTESIMKLTSPAFNNNETLPSEYTCDGEGGNPPLIISDVPENAQSLALIFYDPDAPSGNWTHWSMWNLNPKMTKIAENSVPAGIEGINSYGDTRYGAPCPPSGTHKYIFKLYALDTLLSLTSRADTKQVEESMQGHILDQTELIGTYSRS